MKELDTSVLFFSSFCHDKEALMQLSAFEWVEQELMFETEATILILVNKF